MYLFHFRLCHILHRQNRKLLQRLIAILSLLFTAHISFAQKVWTLEECVMHATENNLTVKRTALNQTLAEYSATQAKLNLLPNINANTAYYFNFGKTIDPTTNLFVSQNTQTNSLSLNASMGIFSGLQKQNTIKQTEYDLLASEAATEQTTNDVLLNVTAAFLQVVFAKENQVIADEQVALSQEQLKRIQVLVQAGSFTQANLYDAEAQAATDEVALVNARNAVATAKLTLAHLLNVTEPLDVSVPEINIQPDITSINQSVEDIYQTALTTQPGIRGAEYQLRSAEKGISIAKGALYPSISLFGSLTTTYSDVYERSISDSSSLEPTTIGYVSTDLTPVINYFPTFTFESVPLRQQYEDNFGQAFGISLDIPIFNNWLSQTNVSRSKVQMLDAQYNLEAVKQQLRTDVQNAWQNAVSAKNSYEAALKAVSSFEKSFNDAQKRYESGALASYDYSVVRNNYVGAQSDLLQAKYQYIFNLKVLDFYLGKPITLQ